MLSINLRHLEEHDLRLRGELPAAELDMETGDEMVHASQPLRYDLEAQKLEGGMLVRGSLRLVLECRCVRCLKPFARELELKEWTCHLPFEGEDKVAVVNDCVDLTPFLREDMLLEFPQHPLCKPDCKGLKVSEQPREENDSAWAELDKLKFR